MRWRRMGVVSVGGMNLSFVPSSTVLFCVAPHHDMQEMDN